MCRLHRLREDALGAPIDAFEEFRVRLAETDEVITTVESRPQDEVGFAERFVRSVEMINGQRRAIRPDHDDCPRTGAKALRNRQAEPTAQIPFPLLAVLQISAVQSGDLSKRSASKSHLDPVVRALCKLSCRRERANAHLVLQIGGGNGADRSDQPRLRPARLRVPKEDDEHFRAGRNAACLNGPASQRPKCKE